MKPRIPTPASDHRSFPLAGLELRYVASAGVIRLVGHAAVFDVAADLGRHRERISRGAFKDTISRDDIRALINHDPQYVLGRNKAGTLKLAEDEKGLAVEINLPDTSYARDLVESIRRGDVNQMSIGFKTVQESFDKDGVRTLEKVKLVDVSPVTFPAYPQTDVKVRRNPRLRLLLHRLEFEAF